MLAMQLIQLRHFPRHMTTRYFLLVVFVNLQLTFSDLLTRLENSRHDTPVSYAVWALELLKSMKLTKTNIQCARGLLECYECSKEILYLIIEFN
jgi:hypothetical protein